MEHPKLEKIRKEGITYDNLSLAANMRLSLLLQFYDLDDINPIHILLRDIELKALFNSISPDNIYKFRLTNFGKNRIKAVFNWSQPWKITDDSNLLIGVYLYGFGNWSKIQQDQKLGLQEKLFLGKLDQAGVAPRSSHLIRRAEYLLKWLVTNPMKKIKGKKEEKAKSVEKKEKISDKEKRKEYLKYLRPVKSQLRKIRDQSDDASLQDKDKVVLVKTCLKDIGNHILEVVKEHKNKDMEMELWKAASSFWPNEIKPTKLRDLFGRIE